jgi:glycine/D-amino acid oxidase-like deaminating enzyme
MRLPKRRNYVVIGGGIHGISTAFHLAVTLKAKGLGSGADVIVLDKKEIGAGASGIACGVVRNNYFQPAMRELMAHSVRIWEEYEEQLSYHPVGYMQISSESMHEDVASIARQQKDICYESVFVEGERESTDYMQSYFHDWRAQGITSVLHEKRGGYSNNMLALKGLADMAEAVGVQIVPGVEVTGLEDDASGAITTVQTTLGNIDCDCVIVGAGPWVRTFWNMLDLPDAISVRNPATGEVVNDVPMWIYWSLQEGTLGVDPAMQLTNDGEMPPVIHVDTDAPLYCDTDGSLLTDKMWGIYYKPDYGFGGIQGGAAPFIVDKSADDVRVDPYGPESPEFIVGDDFERMWTSALAHCQSRFSGLRPNYKNEPSGGIGAFTPDSFPVFDRFRENCYIIADSNHGYKMLGVGKLVAEDICGAESELLKPFRFSRYEKGELHPVSNSPFPWS